MEKRFLHKNYIIVILVISIIFLLSGAYFHEVYNFTVYRLIRGIIPLSILVLLYYYHGKKVYQPISFFLLFYGLSSVATIWYENNIVATLSMFLNFLSFLVLIWALLPKVDLKKMRGLFLVGFILMVLVNGFLIYNLVIMIKSMSLSNMHFIILSISTIALILTAFLVLLYNHTYSTRGTLTFSIFVFLIVFSEVFRALAYYDLAFGDVDVYIARILLIVAMCVLVHYSMIEKKKQEHLNAKFF